MTEMILSQVQAPDMGRLRRVHSVKFRVKVRSSEIRKSWMSSHFFNESRDPESPRKDWRGKSCWLFPQESGPKIVQGTCGVATAKILLGLVSWCGATRTIWNSKIAVDREVFRALLGILHSRPFPEEKNGYEIDWDINVCTGASLK